MSWLPSPTRVLVLMQAIEKGENLLADCSELFWLYCLNSLPPEEFHDRVLFWINRHLEDSPKGGGFIDLDLRDTIFLGPERVANIIIDKLDTLCFTKRVYYEPGQKEDPLALYIYILVEASRLVGLLKTENHSEKMRESLEHSINAFKRCEQIVVRLQNPPWSKEYSESLYAIGSFLYITQFQILKSEGNYQEALLSLFWGFARNMLINFPSPQYGISTEKNNNLTSRINNLGKFSEHAPWMQSLNPQDAVDCFEAIKNEKSNNRDLRNLVSICTFFVTVAKNWWPNDESEIVIKDSKGESWSVPEYWQYALGWTEAQLTPSQFKEIINEREEQAAEKRLQSYFFENNIWEILPERSKRSLISADRDWFNGSMVRFESIFNELTIAIEEILIQLFWNPLNAWIDKNNRNQQDILDFIRFRHDLRGKGKTPNLLDFERIFRMSVTNSYLETKKIPREGKIWLINEFGNSLDLLRKARNKAEHQPGIKFTHEQIDKIFGEFIGIGQQGVIKRLFVLLNYP
jgi:hypothetical protein